MYLESSSLTNNSYYQKFGFEIKKDIFLKRGRNPVRLSIMVREPNTSGNIRKDVGTAAPSTMTTTTTSASSNILMGSARVKFPTVGSSHHHHHGSLVAHGHYHIGLGVGGKKLM